MRCGSKAERALDTLHCSLTSPLPTLLCHVNFSYGSTSGPMDVDAELEGTKNVELRTHQIP